VFRILASFASSALLLWSCSSDSRITCSGQEPDFIAVLKLAGRPLPADTLVHVVYAGSGFEDFRLADPHAPHEVAFCQVADENGVPLDPSAQAPTDADAAGAAGAAGSGDSPPVVESLYCKLWTKGFTQLRVSGSGFATAEYDLTPKEGQCTGLVVKVLDSPDAGSH